MKLASNVPMFPGLLPLRIDDVSVDLRSDVPLISLFFAFRISMLLLARLLTLTASISSFPRALR